MAQNSTICRPRPVRQQPRRREFQADVIAEDLNGNGTVDRLSDDLDFDGDIDRVSNGGHVALGDADNLYADGLQDTLDEVYNLL